jgi:hypothetical protein
LLKVNANSYEARDELCFNSADERVRLNHAFWANIDLQTAMAMVFR